MEKYIVAANTYSGGYGCELTLFAICDTKEEAVKWIIEHPTMHVPTSYYEDHDQLFAFFEGYDEERGGVEDYLRGGRRFVPMTKEEFILKRRNYIHKFDGTPQCLGGYAE